MRRRLARALARPLTLVAAGTVIPLASAAPVAADSVVVGGFPVDVSQSPYTVALSSRDRFGGTRAGQFCGGVAVGRTTVLTAAHCMDPEVLGASPDRVPDLKVIAGRTELLSGSGQEVAVRKAWVNPDYDGDTNSGDFAVLSLAEPLPAASVIGMAGSGDPAYRAGTPATVYGWGTPPAPAATPAACTGRAYGCSPTPCARRCTPGAPTAPTAPRRCCARARRPGAGTPARATAGAARRPGAAHRPGLLGSGLRLGGQPRGLHPHLRHPGHPGVACHGTKLRGACGC